MFYIFFWLARVGTPLLIFCIFERCLGLNPQLLSHPSPCLATHLPSQPPISSQNIKSTVPLHSKDFAKHMKVCGKEKKNAGGPVAGLPYPDPSSGWVGVYTNCCVSLQLIPKNGGFLWYAKAGRAQGMPRNILPCSEPAQTTFDGLIFCHIERQTSRY